MVDKALYRMGYAVGTMGIRKGERKKYKNKEFLKRQVLGFNSYSWIIGFLRGLRDSRIITTEMMKEILTDKDVMRHVKRLKV